MFALDPTHLLIASLVIGFTGGGIGFFPILLSMVGDVAKPEERQEAISTLYFFSSIGMLLGPLITSFLLTMSLTLRNIYQINIVGQAILLLFIVTQIKETKSETMKNTRTKTKSRAIITELLHQKKFQGVITMVFLYFFYYSIINTYIPIYARIELNLSNAQVASFATFRSLATMLIRFLSATILARVPIKPFLLSAIVLGGITCLISPFANNYLYIALVMALSGISFGAVNSLGGTLVAINTTPENRGVANSIYEGVVGFGNVIKILTTPIADALGLSAVFLIGGIVALTATVPILLRKMKG
jgi:MFS family permease